MDFARKYWIRLRESLWFVPTLCVIAAFLLASLLIAAQDWIDPAFPGRLPLIGAGGADGARGVLEAIGASMITIASVAFSVTIVALSLASNQFSPRVLQQFMRDRGNQAALGALVGIFVYCLVVLQTIRAGADDGFVPMLAITGALVLAVVGIAFFIYFIHHIAHSIQASRIIASVASDARTWTDRLFPDPLLPGEDDDARDPLPIDDSGRGWTPVPALHTGYVQRIEIDALLELAEKHDLVVRLEHRVGEFAVRDRPLARVLSSGAVPDGLDRRLNAVFTIEHHRSIEQDVAHGIQQIVDIALKALSVGINDTTTAVTCVDYLTSILVRLSQRRFPSALHHARDGRLRVIAAGRAFHELASSALDSVRRNAKGNHAVLGRLLYALDTLERTTSAPSRRQALLPIAESVHWTVMHTIDSPADREELESQSQQLRRRLISRPAPDATVERAAVR